MNLGHASDSAESASHKIGIYFTPEEIVAWQSRGDDMLRAGDEGY